MARYVPDAGDVVWLNFTPQAGHEQAGHRPGSAPGPAAYNGKVGLMLCCPMTTQTKNYPFEVAVAGTRPTVVLPDQGKSLDWRVRRGAVSSVSPASSAQRKGDNPLSKRGTLTLLQQVICTHPRFQLHR